MVNFRKYPSNHIAGKDTMTFAQNLKKMKREKPVLIILDIPSVWALAKLWKCLKKRLCKFSHNLAKGTKTFIY